MSNAPDWRHRAACRDEDPELFFPVGSTGPALHQIGQAKAVCHRCPVASECLEWALDMGLDAGVFGGKSEDERRALQRRSGRRRQSTASQAGLKPRARTNKTDTTLDQAVVERALSGQDIGRTLSHRERVEVARRVSADDDGFNRIMSICGCSGTTARRLVAEANREAA